LLNSHPTIVSTFASPHEPTLKPKACKRASAFPARVTAFPDGFRITHELFIFNGVRESLRLFAHAQKNKINLCFVDRLVQIENDKKIKLNK
jgi:hypothetical protein